MGGYPVNSMGVPQGTPASSFNLGNLLHMIIYGQHPNTGQLAQQTSFVNSLKQAFNPTTPSGAVNILSMLIPGGDFSGFHGEELPNPGMPGRYEPYNLTKAQASGQVKFREGQPYDVTSHVQAIRDLVQRLNEGHGPDKLQHMQDYMKARIVQHQQAIHDALFGGEVHAKGPIPTSPKTADLLARAKDEAAKTAEVLSRARQQLPGVGGKEQQATDRLLKAHGIEPNIAKGAAYFTRAGHTDSIPDVRVGRRIAPFNEMEAVHQPAILKNLMGGHPLVANAARAAALKQLLLHARNSRN